MRVRRRRTLTRDASGRLVGVARWTPLLDRRQLRRARRRGEVFTLHVCSRCGRTREDAYNGAPCRPRTRFHRRRCETRDQRLAREWAERVGRSLARKIRRGQEVAVYATLLGVTLEEAAKLYDAEVGVEVSP